MTKRKLRKKAISTKTASRINRRAHPRIPTSELVVTEWSEDFAFVVNASNISEGGIFLAKRLKTTDTPSHLRIHFSKSAMDVLAQPIHDEVNKSSFGTGYAFIQMSPEDSRTLRRHLGDLN